MAKVASDESIRSAALDLLRSSGPQAVTVEAVAQRAGVAKTTIYRRYRNRQDVLQAALTSVSDPTPPPKGSDLPAVLEWVITQSHHAVDEGIGMGGLAALLTGSDTASTEVIRAVVARHRRALTTAIGDQIAAGRTREDIDPDTIVDCVVGAYMSERARSGSVAPGWTNRVLATMLPAVVRPDD